VLNWWASYVKTPGGEHAGEAFMPTLEQARWVLWWYAVDNKGRYCYRNGVLRRLKGWGKDPLAAALALVELCGPVAFAGFDLKGEPLGKARHAAWVQIVAVSQEQTKNTMSLFPVMVSAKLKEDYNLEVNKTIIYSEIGGRIESVTSSPHSMEGNRPTLVIRNETQWWVEAVQGHQLAGVIEGNVTKIQGARTLSICNAHIPGEDSVAERDYDAWQAVQSGQAVDVGTLYDALEAPADTPVSEIPSEKEDPEGYLAGVQKLREGILIARGDSVWLPVDAIVESVLDVKNPVTESRRKFLNQVNASEDSWIAPYEWDAVAVPEAALSKGDKITLGFDGSKSNDWTALVACRVEDGCLFLIKAWNPAKYPNEQVPREDVDATVRSCFERFDVVAFRADVKEFEAYVDQWSRDFKKRMKVNASPASPIAFDMRGNQKRFALDCERFLDSVLEQELSHNGDVTLRQHVLHARRHPTIYDAVSIRTASKDSSKKIDAAVCAVLAFGGRQDYLMSKRNRSRRVAVIH
jgi:phage terminase large subunit-like protein